MEYANGTSLTFSQPFGTRCWGKAVCPDGKIRTFHGRSADTFFSVPASVCAGKTRVSGHINVETVNGFSTPTPDDPTVVKFRPWTYGKNYALVMPSDSVTA